MKQNKLIPWYMVFFEKLIVTETIKIFPPFWNPRFITILKKPAI
jgi:hypothetical protein